MKSDYLGKLMDIKDVIKYFKELGSLKLHNRMIGLIGDLGAGKTYLVKELIGDLFGDLKNEVSSPTYTLCNVYKSTIIEIHHYDVYRITSEDELYDTGIFESIESGNILVFVEWIDMYPELTEICDEVFMITSNDEDQRNYILQK